MKQINDFLTSSLAYKDKDFFVFQRETDGVTYRISQENIIKDCIKYTDTDFVASLAWNKLTSRPSIPCSLTGMATGSGTLDLSATVPALAITVNTLNLSSVTLGFTPVRQTGNSTISLEWDSGINATELIIGEGANASYKGPIALQSDLTWANIQNKPILSLAFDGMINGAGTLDLMATNGMTINISDISMKPISWNMVTNKPTLKVAIAGTSEFISFDLDAIGEDVEHTLSINALHSQSNVLEFGTKNQAVSLFFKSAPDLDQYNPTTYDFGIMRSAGNDSKTRIANTIGGSVMRSFDDEMWESWNQNNPLNPTDKSYINRVEIYPLLLTPNLIVTKQKVTELLVDKLNIKEKLEYNGIYIDVPVLIDMISDYVASR